MYWFFHFLGWKKLVFSIYTMSCYFILLQWFLCNLWSLFKCDAVCFERAIARWDLMLARCHCLGLLFTLQSPVVFQWFEFWCLNMNSYVIFVIVYWFQCGGFFSFLNQCVLGFFAFFFLIFNHHFLICFPNLHFVLFIWDANDMNSRHFGIVTEVPEVLLVIFK